MGPQAVFFVAPLWRLVFPVARGTALLARVTTPDTALFATALGRREPAARHFYAKQPMSDAGGDGTGRGADARCLIFVEERCCRRPGCWRRGPQARPALLIAAAADCPAALSRRYLRAGGGQRADCNGDSHHLAVQMLTRAYRRLRRSRQAMAMLTPCFFRSKAGQELKAFLREARADRLGPLWILGLPRGDGSKRPEPRSRLQLDLVCSCFRICFTCRLDHWETLGDLPRPASCRSR